MAKPAPQRRIALAGFVHESNSFAPSPADMAAFAQGGGYLPMSRGDEIIRRAKGVNLPVAGMIDHARQVGWQLLPLIWAGAVPSAPVTPDVLPRDHAKSCWQGCAILAPWTGSFWICTAPWWPSMRRTARASCWRGSRQVVGPDVPVAAALDLHGNITAQMVRHADVMVGFRTYPHVDMAETGRRAAAELERLIAGRPRFKAFRQADYLIPIAWQATSVQPAAGLYDQIAAADSEGACASLFMGFPAADFADCRPSVIAYADSQAKADRIAGDIAAALAGAEAAFAGRCYIPEEGVAEAMRASQGPVIMVDTQDNPGAGGNSDTMGMLRALIAADARDAAIGLIVDPAAAAAAHAAGVGAEIELALGGRSGIAGDAPLEARFVVEALSDGRCHATGPYFGGAQLRLGPSAALRIGGVRIALTSEKAQMADRQMFRFLGIVPEEQAILVVKSSNHFRADFAPIAGLILTCAAPGPMPVSPASLPFRHLTPGIRLEPGGRPFTPPAQTGIKTGRVIRSTERSSCSID